MIMYPGNYWNYPDTVKSNGCFGTNLMLHDLYEQRSVNMRFDNSFLDRQRHQGDLKSDLLVNSYFNNQKQHELYEALSISENDLQTIDKKSDVHKFLLNKRKKPKWYSEKRIISGQAFFASYALEIMTLLGVLALPYCYAGSPGNKALYLSQKMRNSPGKRLVDTAEFIIGVSTTGNLTTNPYGHIHINRTRLIHAIARYYVIKGAWDKEWGTPINQEDMAGTNLAFSYIILNGLRQSGFSISEKQKEDFIYLWRYIGYQMGIEEDLLPISYREAYLLKQKIELRNFRKSEEGIELTKELLRYYQSVAPPKEALFIQSQLSYFLGPKISGYLGLKKDVFKDRITEVANSITELKNYISKHESTFGTMLANQQKLKTLMEQRG